MKALFDDWTQAQESEWVMWLERREAEMQNFRRRYERRPPNLMLLAVGLVGWGMVLGIVVLAAWLIWLGVR